MGEACEAVAGGSSWGVGCVRGRFVRSFVRPFVCSFVRSFVRSFKLSLRCVVVRCCSLFVRFWRACRRRSGVSSACRRSGVSSKWRVVGVSSIGVSSACNGRWMDGRVLWSLDGWKGVVVVGWMEEWRRRGVAVLSAYRRRVVVVGWKEGWCGRVVEVAWACCGRWMDGRVSWSLDGWKGGVGVSSKWRGRVVVGQLVCRSVNLSLYRRRLSLTFEGVAVGSSPCWLAEREYGVTKKVWSDTVNGTDIE